MTKYDELLKNIEELQDLGYKSEFDISDFLLSKDDIVKKILSTKNPYLTKDQINMIVDSEDKLMSEMNSEIEEDLVNVEGKTKEGIEKAKTKKKEEIKAFKEHYKVKLKELYTEASKIIIEVKDAIFNLLKQMIVLAKKAITSLIQTSSSIAAIAMVVVAPPWNIPLAITTAVSVIDIILSFMNEVKMILPFLSPLNKLNLVLNADSLSIVCAILNPAILFIKGLWEKFSSLDSLIKSLIDKILSIISGSNKQKIFKKATARLRKLGYFKNNVDNDDKDEVADLLEIYNVDLSKKEVVSYKKEIDSNQIENLSNFKSPVDYTIKKTIEEIYAYDVLLPNGTFLYGLSEKDLEDLKQSYNIIIDQVSKTIDGI